MPHPCKSAASQAPPPSTRAGHLQQEDYLTIVSWLDNKANFFESCFGKTGKSTAVQSQSTKNNGFKLLANELKKQSKGKMVLTPKQMREQFRTYKLN